LGWILKLHGSGNIQFLANKEVRTKDTKTLQSRRLVFDTARDQYFVGNGAFLTGTVGLAPQGKKAQCKCDGCSSKTNPRMTISEQRTMGSGNEDDPPQPWSITEQE
jgi:hypothetical protein